MAEGGAWQSGGIDNGRGIQKGPPPAGVNAAANSPVPGVPPAMYNPPASMGAGTDGAHLPIISIGLRGACILFCVISFALIGSNDATYVTPGTAYMNPAYYYGSNFYYRATSNSSLAYLLGIDVIVCIYSVVQVIHSIVNSCTGKPVLAGPTTRKTTVTFISDQTLTYMLMAGVGAGGGATRIYAGVSCTGNAYCDKNAAAVAMSFLAFICLALSTATAYFRLYRIAIT